MRFPIKQVITAIFGLAFLIVVLERAGGFSLVVERSGLAVGDLFGRLTPPPVGRGVPNFQASLRP